MNQRDKKRYFLREGLPLVLAVLFLLLFFLVERNDYMSITTETLAPEKESGELLEGQVYSQHFVCERNELEAIQVHLATYWRTNHSVTRARLLEEGRELDRC